MGETGMLKLRTAFMGGNPRMAPLVEGEVKIEGVELEVDPENHGDLFAWLLDHGEDRDVFEFSISHYMTTFEKRQARWDWIAVPIFLQKATPFLETRVPAQSPAKVLGDLRGKRVGMGDYAMTAGVWLRVALNDLYGVPPQEVSWFAGRARHRSHDFQLGVQEMLKPGVSVTWLDDDTALDRMLKTGELDAAFGVRSDDSLRTLLPSGGAGLFEEFHRSYGYLPVNHVLLVRRPLVAENPWLPEALYAGFEASKKAAYRRDPSSTLPLPNQDAAAQKSIYGDDPYPSGVNANRPMLEALIRQSYAEGLTSTMLKVDDLFAESVRNT
jgi:4,5-dihydroxyphthalate decarboxylase